MIRLPDGTTVTIGAWVHAPLFTGDEPEPYPRELHRLWKIRGRRRTSTREGIASYRAARRRWVDQS